MLIFFKKNLVVSKIYLVLHRTICKKLHLSQKSADFFACLCQK
jgi:hypothetical protein